MKKLNKSEERARSTSVRTYAERFSYKPPSTNAERSQYLSLKPRKHKFKSDLA